MIAFCKLVADSDESQHRPPSGGREGIADDPVVGLGGLSAAAVRSMQREAPSTRGGEARMGEYGILGHPKWQCGFHVVFIPKGRRNTLYVQLRSPLEEVFRRLAEQKQIWHQAEEDARWEQMTRRRWAATVYVSASASVLSCFERLTTLSPPALPGACYLVAMPGSAEIDVTSPHSSACTQACRSSPGAHQGGGSAAIVRGGQSTVPWTSSGLPPATTRSNSSHQAA